MNPIQYLPAPPVEAIPALEQQVWLPVVLGLGYKNRGLHTIVQHCDGNLIVSFTLKALVLCMFVHSE